MLRQEGDKSAVTTAESLTREWMWIGSIPTAEKSQMLVGVSGFLTSGKGTLKFRPKNKMKYGMFLYLLIYVHYLKHEYSPNNNLSLNT